MSEDSNMVIEKSKYDAQACVPSKSTTTKYEMNKTNKKVSWKNETTEIDE